MARIRPGVCVGLERQGSQLPISKRTSSPALHRDNCQLGAFTANSKSLLLGKSSMVPRSPPLHAVWLLNRRENAAECIIE